MTVLAEAASDSTTAEAVLSVRDLRKSYGRVNAVDGVSFEVHRGETFGILGPNGAGKTTTLEIIEGLRKPDSGHVEFLGIDAVKSRRRVQELIGVQLQSQALWPELTVEETLVAFQSLFRRRAGIDGLIDRLSLGDKRNALVKQLSGGQKQRLSIAAALVNDPEVLFLDEPTTGLDPQARRSLWDLIDAMGGDGETVIITTHYMDEAEILCDRIAIMDRGRIIATDTPRNLVTRYASESTIECRFAGPPDPNALVALDAAREVRQEADTTLIFTSDASATLAALIGYTHGTGAPMPQLNVRTATLEDVFIALTGRKLRD